MEHPPTTRHVGVTVRDDVDAMRLALIEAHAAAGHDDVPIGAVVVRDGVVIAARHNERELTGDPTAHAEVLAIRDAASVVGHWRLGDCTLYVTLEPCVMCAGALVNARIGGVVYGATDPKAGGIASLYRICADVRLNHRPPVAGGVLAAEAGQLLRDFFAARRNVIRNEPG
ncbi:MAG: nucleoside deaminase [Ilumatobacteraceae bacterium]